MGYQVIKMPERIQLRRTKGWRMPPNNVKVARPTIWGNPHRVGWCPRCEKMHSAEEAVRLFELYARGYPLGVAKIREALKGKSLACFCPLDQPCHADVLLEIANS